MEHCLLCGEYINTQDTHYTSPNGFIYKDGIIQYGRLDKEEKTFKIRARTELCGTFDTSNDQDLRMLIKIIGLQEKIEE